MGQFGRRSHRSFDRAFAGFSLALWYDRRRLHQEKEEARKVVARSLLEEIQGNLLTLKIERAQLALLRIVSYSSAKTSGRLDVFNFNLVRQIEDVYFGVEQLNRWVDTFNAFTFSAARALSSFPEEANKILSYIQTMRAELAKPMELLGQSLKQEIESTSS